MSNLPETALPSGSNAAPVHFYLTSRNVIGLPTGMGPPALAVQSPEPIFTWPDSLNAARQVMDSIIHLFMISNLL